MQTCYTCHNRPIWVDVGGHLFCATRHTWEKSFTIRLQLDSQYIFIDRDPAMFHHILTWLREGILYIDRPDEFTYDRLCSDAIYYRLDGLHNFLMNRINVCRYVTLVNGQEYPCYVEGFRKVGASGMMAEILDGRYPITNDYKIRVGEDLSDVSPILLDPHIRYKFGVHHSPYADWLRKIFGDKIITTPSGTGIKCMYDPIATRATI